MRALTRFAIPAGVGVLSALALNGIGLQTEFAWGWGALAAAVALMLRVRMPDEPRADAPGRAKQHPYTGSDVSRLAWAINLQGDSVTEAVTRRVRATLRRRLAREGVDVDDERQSDAVEQRLGAGLWLRLNGRGATVQDIREALAVAERLGAEDKKSTTQNPIQREIHERR